MPKLGLTQQEKQDTEFLINAIDSASTNERKRFHNEFTLGNEAAWHRFIRGAWNHPITWWIGIFQLTMQFGIWGHQQRSAAQVRANLLWRATTPIRNEISEFRSKGDAPLLSAIIQYNLQYRKADISGRLLGGEFTNYATLFGRTGSKRLSARAKKPVRATNFIIASYGAAIRAVAHGHQSAEAIIQSVLTGRPEHLPQSIRNQNSGSEPQSENENLKNNTLIVLEDLLELTKIEPGPVPINEFCARPENRDLKGLCR